MEYDDAVKLANSGWWNFATNEQIVDFQLNEERLCMPFDRFQEAVEKVLGRSVWTHEFARPENLRAELVGDRPRPTFQEICDMIPEDKRVVLDLDAKPNEADA